MKKLNKFIKKHIVFEPYNEWEQLDWRKKWNWLTFTLVHIFFECEHHGYMFQFVLFGVGFSLRYNTDRSLKLFKQWEKELREDLKEFKEMKKIYGERKKANKS